MASDTGSARGAWSLRTHFFLFGLILILPLAGLSAFLLHQVAERDREQLEQRMVQIARGVAADLDRELQRRMTVLETLARSLALQNEDFAVFHAQASAALQRDRTGIFLIDRTQQQILNTYAPYGTVLPKYGSPETAERAFAQKLPQFSDLFIGLISQRPALDIVLPIVVDGEIKYLLVMGMEPFMLQELLVGLGLPPDWIVGITDRRGTVVARSRDPERLVGTQLRRELSAQLPGTAIHAIAQEGHSVLRSTARSELSGWQVAVNVPEEAAGAMLRSNMSLLGLWSILAILLTAGLAAWFARAIAQPLRKASNAAADLAQARPVTPFRSRLDEANELVAALHGASVELSKAKSYQQMLLGELNHRVKNLLSVIIAMTARTLAGEATKGARDLLVQRFHSLARAHDLLVKNDWVGAPLTGLIEAELKPFQGRVRAQGPEIVLKPSAAQTLTMVVHELVTNAVKYGALSSPGGSVCVSWMVQGDAERVFSLRWEEAGGPAVVPPTRKGFGTTLLEASFMQGTARLSYAAGGMAYEVEAPLSAVTDELAFPLYAAHLEVMRFDPEMPPLRRVS